ncbi:MAG: SDR family oxidoreductase [Deltaproteobacteria bacterium]|nr:MAG: SDR family oxidoreductase [Deltaproteobacteria bacterium]
MKRLYLVTGGAGFIGSHIVEELVKRGERVRVIDNLSTGKREKIQHLMNAIDFMEGDLRDLNAAMKAVEGVDFVLHQAAIPSVPRSIKDPKEITEHNVNGTLHLLIAARSSDVERVVYASSSSVYGDSPILPKAEDFLPSPLSPYAASKLAGEYYCQVFHQVYGLETVCLRYFNVFGPRQDPLSPYAAVIPKFVSLALEKRPLVVYGDGEQTRDFSFVANIVQTNLLACEAKGVAGETMNVGCGDRISINQLAEELKKIIDPNLIVEYTSPRPGDVEHSQASIEKASKLLGYEPAISFAEGLRQTVEWFEGNIHQREEGEIP